MAELRLGVLASGSGSNLQSILDACAKGALPARVAAVICNIPGARALTRAEAASVPALCLPHQGLKRDEYDRKVVAALHEHRVDLVCLAGFMRILSPVMVRAFPGRILNIHPSLLPSFPGLHAVRQALEAGVRLAGCTVHFVDEGCDTGPIVVQAAVPVLEGDTEESLGARIQLQEHQAYPHAIRLVAEGRVRLASRDGRPRAVTVDLPERPTASLTSPPLEEVAP